MSDTATAWMVGVMFCALAVWLAWSQFYGGDE